MIETNVNTSVPYAIQTCFAKHNIKFKTSLMKGWDDFHLMTLSSIKKIKYQKVNIVNKQNIIGEINKFFRQRLRIEDQIPNSVCMISKRFLTEVSSVNHNILRVVFYY